MAGCLHQVIARLKPTRRVSSLQPEPNRGILSHTSTTPQLCLHPHRCGSYVTYSRAWGSRPHLPTTHTDTVFPAKPSQALGVSQDKAGSLAFRLEPDSGLNDGLSKSYSQSSLWELKQVIPPLLGELWNTMGRVGRKGVRQGPELGCKERAMVA